jgi:hypothetical protein
MISPSYLLQILLPEETGSGQPNPADMFEGVLQELTDKFGGATSLLHVSSQGLWRRRSGTAILL